MSHTGHRRKVDKFNMTRKQGGHASPVSSVSARQNGSRESVFDNRTDSRVVRENFKKERKLESYLADDANFPDFSKQLEKMGLQLRDIPGDGNCLFRALGDQLEGHCRNHFKHRQDVVRYMAEHRKDFEPFTEDEIPFEDHLQNLRKLGVYAGNDAIVAFARLHQVNIVIHQLSTKNLMITGSQNVNSRQLHISYHNGDHYSSVRKQNDNTESPACIKLLDAGKDAETFGKVTFDPAMTDGCVRARRGFDAIEEEVMTATNCQDRDMVKKTLTDYDFDAEATIVHLMQIMELTGGQEFGAYGTWSPNGAGIWSQGAQASGRRTDKDERGHVREDSCGESSGYGSLRSNSEGVHLQYSGVPHQNAYHGLTSRKKKEKKKAEKKSRARERHRQQFLPVVVASSSPPPGFSVLSSPITRI